MTKAKKGKDVYYWQYHTDSVVLKVQLETICNAGAMVHFGKDCWI